jgi:hypothetical protein
VPQVSLLSEFRRRIQDVRYSQRAFGLGISAESGATSAIAELTNGHLIVSIAGGSAPSLDISLTNTRFDTVGKIYQSLSRATGYRAQIDEDVVQDHPSIDLEPFGPVDILGSGIDLKHRLFSDAELEDILRDSIRRHNPSLSISTLPQQEAPFVFMLAHASVCRDQAYNAAKRKGLDSSVDSLIQLAESFEKAYQADIKRLHNAIAPPKESNPNTMHEGDIVLGKIFRRSSRTGMSAAIASNIPPDAAVLLEPGDLDAEDTSARVIWQRNTEVQFYSYELWMDSRPEVVRSVRDDRPTTSKLVFRSYGSNSSYNLIAFATFTEQYGQLARSFVKSDLEPETDYYFRLYISDLNRESVASNVVRVRTKARRCKFDSTTFVSPATGPVGTTVHVYFDSTAAAFTSSHILKLGEKTLTTTIVSSYHVTFVIPSFVKLDVSKDLVVISPNGLTEVKRDAVLVSSI